ncbi:FAD binding domain-containing protein [Actinomadura sp. WAC 06369]|uniref:FAD binding domain-containing protein n=1 Tax=Actinomadura sp. WAC 06369 TaxID=2203193 RepID=UPI000F772374|nr:FAD binding domain-containing protein [Actinomadura sp. WAC 06369]RSN51338.1 carbon monoxide dehydrogenase [Actinomadura sp. WAC 06369]
MEFLRPATWEDALAAKAAHPGALPIQGGTDVMVEINFDARRPEALLDLTRVGELAAWDEDGGTLRVGAGVPYARLIRELGDRLPGLAQASRTVGSPQIRNRGTVGGNLGAASPAGDAHPPLLAGGAVIEVESAARGVRLIPAEEFYLGVKRSALEPDELIRAFRVRPASGPQYFSKVGTRNAMVIAVCSFAVALHPDERRVGTGFGSAAATPRRAREAEEFAAAGLDWDGRGPLRESAARAFGELVARAAAPIDDVRGTADYRRRALAVMARRTLTWAWNDHRAGIEGREAS